MRNATSLSFFLFALIFYSTDLLFADSEPIDFDHNFLKCSNTSMFITKPSENYQHFGLTGSHGVSEGEPNFSIPFKAGPEIIQGMSPSVEYGRTHVKTKFVETVVGLDLSRFDYTIGDIENYGIRIWAYLSEPGRRTEYNEAMELPPTILNVRAQLLRRNPSSDQRTVVGSAFRKQWSRFEFPVNREPIILVNSEFENLLEREEIKLQPELDDTHWGNSLFFPFFSYFSALKASGRVKQLAKILASQPNDIVVQTALRCWTGGN